jgi:putative colanic acid biosynthesis acetyltransferase WcaF
MKPETGNPVSHRERWPYSPGIYLRRALWRVVWLSVWKLAHWRLTGVRGSLLRLFGARVGRASALRASTWIEMPWELTVGDRCLFGESVTIYNLGEISIGNDTVISQGAHLCGGTHDYTDPSFPLRREGIRVGEHVWIAADAFVGPGVTIGNGAVVAARAVVTADVEPWTVVGGNPARPIKRRELHGISPS